MISVPILVTGGNGWLGKRVLLTIRQNLSPHTKVTCLIPEGDETAWLTQNDIVPIYGDIRDLRACKSLLTEAKDAILIHLAGVIHPKRMRDFREINTEATLALRSLADQAGVKRMVVMSSNSPMGCNPHPDHRFTEESPYNPYMGYGYSKWKMEEGLRAAMAQKKAPEITIIRAPWFYGPGQPPRQTQFFTMIKNGKFPMVGNGRNRRSMGYVDNLAQGILLAATLPEAANEIFWLADEIPYSMQEIIETVSQVLHEDFGLAVAKKQPRLPSIVSDIAEVCDKLLQTAGVYQQKIHVLSEMNKTIACDITKAKKLLGYTPLVSLREGMRRSVEWCLENKQKI
jgi:nucleoside-diphosphate-sugar epimerase